MEQAVRQVGADLFRVRVRRQREAPDELSVRALDAVIALLLRLLFESPLAFERQDAVLDAKRQVFLFEAGKLEVEAQLFGRLRDVDRRGPESGRRGLIGSRARTKGLSKETIHLTLKGLEIAEWVVFRQHNLFLHNDLAAAFGHAYRR